MIADIFGREIKEGMVCAYSTRDDFIPTIGIGLVTKMGDDFVTLKAIRVAHEGGFIKSDRTTIKRLDKLILVDVSEAQFYEQFDQGYYVRNYVRKRSSDEH